MIQSFVLLVIINCSLAYPRNPRIYNVLISSKKNLAPSQAVPVYEHVLRTAPLGYSFTPFVYTHLGPLPDTQIYAQQGIVNQNFKVSPVERELPAQNPNVVPVKQYATKAPDNPRQYQNIPSTSQNQDIPTVTQYHTAATQRPYQDEPPSLNQYKDAPNKPAQYQDVQAVGKYADKQQYQVASYSHGQYHNVPLSQSNLVQQNQYPRTLANTKSLPSNVVPLDQYVPYHTPFAFPFYPTVAEIPRLQPEQQPVTYKETREQTDDPKQIVANYKSNPEIPDVPPPPLPVKTS